MNSRRKLHGLCAVIVILINIAVHASYGHVRQSRITENSKNFTARNATTNEIDLDVNRVFIGRQENTTSKECEVGSSVDHFPDDLFTDEQRRNGAFLLHLLAAVYCFTFLGCACNDYFLPAVECICEDLNIPKDVAAATFMAMATAMPDFFTNTISTLVTNSSMGIGSVIGSLMFNTLGVAALTGLFVVKPIQLDWWPVCRDCVIYSFHIMILLIVAWGGYINLAESIVMVIFCIMYFCCIVITNYKVKNRLRTYVEDHLNCCHSTRYDLSQPAETTARGKLPFHKKYNDRLQSGVFAITPTEFTTATPTFTDKDIQLKENIEDGDEFHLFKLPKGGFLDKLWWAYVWPIRFILTCLCPNPKTFPRLYPLSFIICIGFVGANSFIIVWMLSVFGTTFGIPDVVMGLTLSSAGSATPEAISSIVSVRKGESGIGVSNALGSNSLSILLALGVPWFVKNAANIYTQDDEIRIGSQGIEIVIGILFLSVITLFVILFVSGFRLSRRTGLALLIAYIVYIAFQVMIEMHIFFPAEEGC